MKTLDTTFTVSLMLFSCVFTSHTFSRSCSSTEVNSRSHDISFELIHKLVVQGYIFLCKFELLFISLSDVSSSAVQLLVRYFIIQ